MSTAQDMGGHRGGGTHDEHSPAVSVIMPMLDTAPYVEDAVRSVLAQTYDDVEVLVVDDGSTDGSVEIVAALAATDPRVHLLRNTGEKGAAHARNTAIAQSRGRYVAFLDSDDQWLPTKLEKQLELMRRTGVALSYTQYHKISADSAVTTETHVPEGRVVRAPDAVEYRHMLRQDYIGCLTAMYDADQLGRRYMPDIARRQDYALWLDILRGGRLARGVPEPLALYRAQRPGSLSANKFRAAGYNWTIYRHVERLPLGRALVAFANYAVRSSLKFLV